MSDAPTMTPRPDTLENRRVTPPKPDPASRPAQPPHNGGQEIRLDEQPTAGPAVWGFTIVGLFLFVFHHSPFLFVHPLTFLLGVLIWGVLFGVPARIFHRNRMRRCLTGVAVLFFLAAGLDVVSKVYFETIPPSAPPPAPETGTTSADQETNGFFDRMMQAAGGRPRDVPDVRMQMKSTESGYLDGTVHNDTGKRIEKLKLSIQTERWTRIHEVKVSAEPNTTKDFMVYIGDGLLDVKSFSVLK